MCVCMYVNVHVYVCLRVGWQYHHWKISPFILGSVNIYTNKEAVIESDNTLPSLHWSGLVWSRSGLVLVWVCITVDSET